ncbi:MAG: hypothetical protein JO304_17020, partial [Solirubrobacterales bacterium]|nr:hypothetical protein [Solirubrobacterales bacterium]
MSVFRNGSTQPWSATDVAVSLFALKTNTPGSQRWWARVSASDGPSSRDGLGEGRHAPRRDPAKWPLRLTLTLVVVPFVVSAGVML